MNTQIESSENNQTNLTTQGEDYIDKLDREKLAKNFVSVLTSQNANVFSINGGWGSGKTWFLKFVENECEKQNIPFVQFNVWKNDYCDFPLQAIVAEITKLLKQYHSPESKEILDMEENVNNFLKFLAPFAPLIKFDASKLITVASYNDFKKLKDKFIDSLVKCLENNEEIIIAIDELDRCRPDYAIKTLEVIKHFFHIPKIKFILAVDKEQLARTVKTMFGQDADTDCYLRKFVDIEYNIPALKNSDIHRYVEYCIKNKHPNINIFCLQQNSANNILYTEENRGYFKKNTYGSDNAYIEVIIKSIIESFNYSNLSLRDLEKLFLKLDILTHQFGQVQVFNFEFLWNLLIINIKYNDLYILIENPEVSIQEVRNYLKIATGDKNKVKYYDSINGNSLLMYIIDGIKHKLDVDYAYTRRSKATIVGEVSFLYSKDLKKYFEIINLSEGFE